MKAFPHRPTLVEVHRQDDVQLITAVNELERGELNPHTIAFMNSLNRPLSPHQMEKASYLFARNIDVQIFNHNRIMNEPGQLHIFTSEDEGDKHFLNKFLVPQRLGLKVNCLVMLVTNISEWENWNSAET